MEEEEDSTAAVVVDFMEEAEEGFTAVEASLAAATPLAVIVVVDIAAEASTEVAAFTEVVDSTAATAVMDGAAGATDGAVEVGVTEEAGDGVGAGDLDLGGRIGDMAGDIRIMATTDMAWGITRPTLTIPTRPTGILRTISGNIPRIPRIPTKGQPTTEGRITTKGRIATGPTTIPGRITTTGTALLHRQIPARSHSPIRTDRRRDCGDLQCREARATRTMQTAMRRPLRSVGRFSRLTG